MMNYNNLERKRLKRRKVISRLLGILLILLGLFAGIYFGIYQCFILAIVDVIDGVKSNFDAMQIAIGIAKLLIGSSFSEFIAIILIYWGIIGMCQVNVGNFFIFFSNPLNAIAFNTLFIFLFF